MPKAILNHGLIEQHPSSKDDILGAGSRLPTTVLSPERDWTKELPDLELQKQYGFDTYGCVSYSKHNCQETLIKKKYKRTINFSDRFTVVDSGTTPGVGNSLAKVAQHSRKNGILFEEEYPWTKDVDSVSEYYAPISQDKKDLAKKRLEIYSFTYEWVGYGGVDPETLWEALQYAPLQVTVKTWGKLVNGIYQRPKTTDTNHAVELYKGEYKKYFDIYDHYDKKFKRLAWDYYFGSCMRHDVTITDMLELIKGDRANEIYALGKDGKLYHVYNMPTLNTGASAGMWGNTWTVKPQAEVDAMPKANSIGFLI